MEVRNIDGSVDLYDQNFIEEHAKQIAQLGNGVQVGFDPGINPITAFALEKIGDPVVESVCIHKSGSLVEIPEEMKVVRLNNKPGEIINQSDRKYIVQEDGSWKRIDK